MERIITKVSKVTPPIKNESLFQEVLSALFQLGSVQIYIVCVITLELPVK